MTDARSRQRRAQLTPDEGATLAHLGGVEFARRVQLWLLREALDTTIGQRDIEAVSPKEARAAAQRVVRAIRHLQAVLADVPRDVHEWVHYHTGPGTEGPASLPALLTAAAVGYERARDLKDAAPRRRDVERRRRRSREFRLLLPRTPRLSRADTAEAIRVYVGVLARLDGTTRGSDDVARWLREICGPATTSRCRR